MRLALHPTRPYVIAELGTSCDASPGNMLELAKHAVAAGASAIKIQDHEWQHVPDEAKHPAWFQGAHGLETRKDYVLRQVACSGNGWFVDLMRRHGPHVPLIVSPFSVGAVESAAGRKKLPDCWKIASGQVTNHALIRACVETGLPIILSSGMTTREENEAAWKLVPRDQLWCVMDCTSAYPTQPEHTQIAKHPAFSVHNAQWHGFSDHSEPESSAAAVVALRLGARVFERHVTFSRLQYGSDAKWACELPDFARYCRELDRASRIPTGDVRDQNAERLKDVREQFLVRTA